MTFASLSPAAESAIQRSEAVNLDDLNGTCSYSHMPLLASRLRPHSVDSSSAHFREGMLAAKPVAHGVVGVLALLLAAAPALAADAPVKSIAVTNLTPGPGVDAKLADVVTTALVDAVQRRSGAPVTASADIQAMLGFERQKQLLGCSEEDGACLAELAGALGTTHLVSGSLAKVGESYVFSAQLLDMKVGRVVQRFQHRVKAASPEAFLDVVPMAAEALFPAEVAARVGVEKPVAGTTGWTRGHSGWVLAGSGVALAIGGGLLGMQAYSAAASAPEAADYDAALGTSQRYSLGANVLFAAAAVAVGIGGWLLWSGSSSSAGGGGTVAAATSVGFAASPDGAAFTINGTF